MFGQSTYFVAKKAFSVSFLLPVLKDDPKGVFT